MVKGRAYVKKYEKVAELSANVQLARTTQEMQEWLNDMLLFISKGSRYEADVKLAVEAYEKLYELKDSDKWAIRNKL